MNGFLSGSLYSLLAQRRFLFQSHFNDMFNARKEGWHYDAAELSEQERSTARHTDMIDTACFPEDAEWSKRLSSQNGIHPEAWGSPSLISIATNCPLVKYWGRNPSLQAKYTELGLIDSKSSLTPGFQIAHQMVRFLLQPCPELETKVRRVFESGNMSKFVIIGVQVRMGGAPIGEEAIFGPPNVDWSVHFMHCAKHASKELKDPRPVKYFISGDRPSVFENAKNILGADAVMSGPGPVTHTSAAGKAADALHRAAIDSLYMGMYASAVVITPGSTFGSLAAVASGRNPYHVVVDEGPEQFQCKKTDLKNPPHRYHLGGSQTFR
jgi:hypothetical protein